jgi:hypothetical protein
MSEKKFVSIEKHKIFLFQVFDLRFFTQIFILQQCLYTNPKGTHSIPKRGTCGFSIPLHIYLSAPFPSFLGEKINKTGPETAFSEKHTLGPAGIFSKVKTERLRKYFLKHRLMISLFC